MAPSKTAKKRNSLHRNSPKNTPPGAAFAI
jgi:hypothetical protein